jgi:hypothetical protein
MMALDIPRNEWVGFFTSFSHQHQGWPVSLEINHSDLSNLKTPYLPLEDIEVNSEDGSEDIIIIFIGGLRDKYLCHIIVAPLRIKLEQMGGTSWTLEIYSAMGATTILPGLSDESERLNGNTKVPSNALFN